MKSVSIKKIKILTYLNLKLTFLNVKLHFIFGNRTVYPQDIILVGGNFQGWVPTQLRLPFVCKKYIFWCCLWCSLRRDALFPYGLIRTAWCRSKRTVHRRGRVREQRGSLPERVLLSDVTVKVNQWWGKHQRASLRAADLGKSVV